MPKRLLRRGADGKAEGESKGFLSVEGLWSATSHPLVLLSVKEGGPAEQTASHEVLPLQVLTMFPD